MIKEHVSDTLQGKQIQIQIFPVPLSPYSCKDKKIFVFEQFIISKNLKFHKN